MTSLEKLVRANRWRIRAGSKTPSRIASTDQDGWNGHFLVPLEGEVWHVIISDGMGWKHLSISNAQKKMLPTWTVMSRVKACFYGDDEWVVQFHPPVDQYINDHPFTLHLWCSIETPMPHPEIVLV